MALITVYRATELIPNFPSGDTTVMTDCVNAASDVIVRYCNRDFVQTTYDELYHGTGAYNLLLNQYPVTQVLRVAHCEANVMQVNMTNQSVSRASIRLDGDSSTPPLPNNIYLISYLNGVETTITIAGITTSTPTYSINGANPTTFSQMYTITNLASAINTYGSAYGWSAAGLGQYATWPIADLRPPQGAFECRWFGNAYLIMHAWNMPLLDQNPAIGELVSPLYFDRGYNNYRVVYQAGYTTIPNPIQQACAALAVSVYLSRGTNSNMTAENLGGYTYTAIADRNFKSLDIVSRFGLAQWKNHRAVQFKV